MASLFIRSGRRPPARGPVGARFVFVIPAHDEEGSIRRTVESCRAVDYDAALFRVVVVADNCTDATAQVAHRSGAEVLVRDAQSRRGKGYALEYFFAHHPVSGPDAGYDAAVVVDADSVVDPKILVAFSRALAEGKDWVQCYNTIRNRDASWRTQLLTYSFSLFNGVWLLGQERLGLSASLRGNGMCLSCRGLRRHPWSAYGLVEDMEFSWALRLAGERVRFAPETFVLSEMVSRGGRAAKSQCRRWDTGRRALRSKFIVPLLKSKGLNHTKKLIFLIELMFPPLVPLLVCFAATLCVHFGPPLDPRLEPLSRLLAPLHGLIALALLLYGLSPIFAMKLPMRYLFTIFWSLPYYTVWKIQATVGGRPSEWVRTERELAAQSGGGAPEDSPIG